LPSLLGTIHTGRKRRYITTTACSEILAGIERSLRNAARTTYPIEPAVRKCLSNENPRHRLPTHVSLVEAGGQRRKPRYSCSARSVLLNPPEVGSQLPQRIFADSYEKLAGRAGIGRAAGAFHQPHGARHLVRGRHQNERRRTDEGRNAVSSARVSSEASNTNSDASSIPSPARQLGIAQC